MKNLEIIQFDNDDSYFLVADIILEQFGLKVSHTASDPKSTKDLINKIQNKQIKPDIAIIDDYLGVNFNDGMKLAEKLKEVSPNTKIIAYVTDGETKWGDYLALKSGINKEKSLITVFEQLTGKSFPLNNA